MAQAVRSNPNAGRFPSLGRLGSALSAARLWPASGISGTVRTIGANSVSISGIAAHCRLGDLVEVGEEDPVLCEVLAISDDIAFSQPLAEASSLRCGSSAVLLGPIALRPSKGWKGRVLDCFGRPLDGGGPVPFGPTPLSPFRKALDAMKRGSAGGFAKTGVKVIDLFTPLCHGQRVGIFGAAGSGKSTLLNSLLQAPGFDTVVVGLIGERGREVRDFFMEMPEARRSSTIVIASTCDESAAARVLAASVATLAAEYLRDEGENVLLIIDSVTRFAHAVREASLSSGALPVVRGHTTSLYGSLAALIERAGPGAGKGSVTAIYSVLVEGDDPNEPVSDAIRGILDGHIMLDRRIAEAGRYPAINVLESISRLASRAHDPTQAALAAKARSIMSLYEDSEEMRRIGGYTPGIDPATDKARQLCPKIYDLIGRKGAGPKDDAFQQLRDIVGG